LILDTHTLVWVLLGNEKLGPLQVARIEDSDMPIYVSAVSGYEIANKFRTGKFPQAASILELAQDNFKDFDWKFLPVTLQHARLAGGLDGNHRDPFDRILAAQSIVENMPIMTIDLEIRKLGAEVIW
jgi:PIN domain nuclease of toxin-antitoxin system